MASRSPLYDEPPDEANIDDDSDDDALYKPGNMDNNNVDDVENVTPTSTQVDNPEMDCIIFTVKNFLHVFFVILIKIMYIHVLIARTVFEDNSQNCLLVHSSLLTHPY